MIEEGCEWLNRTGHRVVVSKGVMEECMMMVICCCLCVLYAAALQCPLPSSLQSLRCEHALEVIAWLVDYDQGWRVEGRE